uniref:Tachykinin-related peptide 5 n=5 Tax=Pentatominae TaxID=286710 RepID=TRP5_NEZVI|nr:RecName: Full=Tachykinin-related peptide 5; Short=TKRP-5 [Acrosternum hilare]P86567.1 RecName: Full=Tachykinin-related peptide 5; Short=TKRP-5 [Banasa dimiata]P86573.1 RecName: Full=Tachykinin-related peptide 5; Short=TKRP-5 [Euschistus servus]P86579.1 RecName: Full=Tachykinin-related peptide 5; Short=TKRP-5 [Nezara viridula]P86591.1 RecName: Full=Tachykinin-related peptide 5; Short=TKRP-5 [Pentatoma rufipes]
APLMGFQGVR